MNNHIPFLNEAIALSIDNVKKNNGGPFGAVVVCNKKIIARGVNQVLSTNDPTAHAEIVAIRNASKKLKRFDLSDCAIYSSCEPCPMCLSAIYWAKISAVYYANTKVDAENIGFSDDFIYEELSKPLYKRSVQMKQLLQPDAIKAFELWDGLEGKTNY